MRHLLLLIACFVSLSLFSSVQEHDNKRTSIDIKQHQPRYQPLHSALRYLEDHTGKLQIDSVRDIPPERWWRPETDYPSFGVTQSTYWFVLPLTNQTPERQALFFHVNFPTFDELKVYVDDGAQVKSFPVTGESFPFHTRPVDYPSFLFPIELEPQQSLTLYVKADSDGAMQLPFELWQQSEFYSGQISHLLFYSALLAVFLVMGLYHLFLYYPTRDRSYLLYSVFCLVTLGFYISHNGFAFQFVWPESPNWQSRSTLFYAGLANTTLCLFTIQFLNLKRYRLWYITVSTLAAISGFMAIVMLFFPIKYAIRFQLASLFVVALTVFAIGIRLWLKRKKIARFFVIAWSAFFLCAFYTAAGKLNIIKATYLTDHGIGIGTAMSIILLSFALADRINLLQQSRVRAQKQSLVNMKKFKSIFDSVVEGIFIISTKGEWISANPSLLNLLQVDSLKDLNQTFSPTGTLYQHEQYQLFLSQLKSNESLRDFKFQMPTKDGRLLWCSVNASREGSKGGDFIEGTLLDISERRKHEARLEYLAKHDSLTGLYNRRAFEDCLMSFFQRCDTEQPKGVLLYLDLDQFKLINDTCGHSAGDGLLQQLAKTLQRHCYDSETIARLGGDEFGVFIANCSEKRGLRYAEKYLDVISQFRYRVGDKDFTIGVSIGLVACDNEYQNVETLLSQADTACFLAKDLGRNRIHVYRLSDDEIRQRQSEMEWISVIKQCIHKDHFELFYQQLMPSENSQSSYHYELLLRLKHEGKLISPAAFLPAVERYGLMPIVDRWVVQHYFSWLKQHPEQMQQLSLASINISGHSICDEKFDVFLNNAFQTYRIEPTKICFEITESMAITRLDQTVAFINRYKRMGCQFALDDFGTGFSSYAYLKNLPVNYLKIDGVFIKDIATDRIDYAMVKSIREVAAAIGIKTVAEYVDSQPVVDRLIEMGIDYQQGYFHHKPESLSRLLEASKRTAVSD